MNKKLLIGLIATVAFQFIVLTGMYIKAALPLWFGQEIKVNTIPIDPRSLFRGNYARLRYDFSQIDKTFFTDTKNLREGEIVFVLLKLNTLGIHEFSSISIKKPEQGVFIRGRLENHRWRDDIQIKYGIEAFFAPKDKALKLEKTMQKGALAVLMVSNDGKARIKKIVSKNKQ